MRVFYRLMVIVALLTVCAGTASANDIEVKWIDDVDEAWAMTQSEDRPLLLFITQDRCKYCTKMKQGTYQDGKTVTLINDHFVAVEISGTQAARLVKKLGIRAFPTTVVITPDAKVADQVKGYLPPAKFNKRLLATVGRVDGPTTRK